MANDNESGGKKVDPKAAEDLAKGVASVRAAAREASAALDAQLKIIMQMRDAMAEVAKNMGDASDKMGGMSSKNMQALAAAVEKTNTATTGWRKTLLNVADSLRSKLTPAALVTQATISGLAQGFNNLAAITKGTFGIIVGIGDAIFSVGKAILAIPFRMMDALFGAAQKASEAMQEIAKAREEVREAFGSLKSEASAAILTATKSMAGFKDTGLSLGRVFENTAERMRFMLEMAQGMGAQFNNFTQEMKENGGALAAYQKGLGLTAEQMGGVAETARRMGTSMSKVLLDVTKHSQGMSKAFGINAKILSRDMAVAMKDLAHFGHLSTKEIALAAAFANKLGVSVEKLTGMMDATQTFDQAAEGMAKLNEQYNTNIDATKVMAAQTPDEKFALIAKGFRDAGKDLSKLTYQDRAFIKAQTGMDDAVLNAMITNKDAATMHEKMAAAADKNEKKTYDQATAMHELADSIKRITKAAPGAGGILDRILDGISRGIQNSPPFLKIMSNISQIFREAFSFGRQLGRMFVDLFPGVKEMLGGLANLFDPKHFRAMFKEVLSAFDILKSGGPDAVGKFIGRIGDIFNNFFGKESKAGQQIYQGGKIFLKALSSGVSAGFGWIKDKISAIKNEIVTYVEEEVWPDLKVALAKLGLKIVEFISKPSNQMMIGGALAALLVGPAVGGIVLSVGTAALGNLVGATIKKAVLGSAIKKATEEGGAKVATSIVEGVAKSVGDASTTAQAQTSLIGRLTGFLKTPLTGILKGGWRGILGGAGALAGAAIAGWEIGSLIREAAEAQSDKTNQELKASIIESNKKTEQIFKKNNPLESYNKGVEEINKQAREQFENSVEKRSWWQKASDAMSGDFNVAARRAQEIEDNRQIQINKLRSQALRSQRELIAGTREWQEKMDDENKKAIAAAEESRKQAIADLGPVTIENAFERFKKIDALAKKMMGKGFNIEDNLKSVREKLSKIDFGILDKKKQDEINETDVNLKRIRDMFVSLADLSGLAGVAAARLTKFEGLSSKGIENLKTAIGGIKAAFPTGGATTYMDIAAQFEHIKNVFRSMSEALSLIKNLSTGKLSSKLRQLPNVAEAIESISGITSSIAGVTSKVPVEPGGAPILTIKNNLVFLQEVLRLLAGDVSGVSFQTFVDLIDRIGKSISSSSAKQITRTLKVINDMVAATQKMEDAMSKIGTINVGAKLEKVAGGLGFGGSYNYEVKSKAVVIHLDFQVTMNADEVEKAVVFRQRSVIRDRLNFAVGDKAPPLTTVNEYAPLTKPEVT